MPRKRTIDDVPIRYCGNCSKPIPKQKPGGKWKTPAQYAANKACCKPCTYAMRNKTQRETKAAKRKGEIQVTLSEMDLFLQKPLR